MNKKDPRYKAIKEALECAICCELMQPPIAQCETGHSMCARCARLSKKCPTCKKSFGVRNYQMEKFTTIVKYPCEFKRYGCKDKLFVTEKSIHEFTCQYLTYPCPYENCDWNAKLSNDLENHIAEVHSNSMLNMDTGRSITYHSSNLPRYTKMIAPFNGIDFLITAQQVCVGNITKHCMVAQAICSEEEASKYGIRIKKYTYTSDVTRYLGEIESIHTPLPPNIQDSRNALMFETTNNVFIDYSIFELMAGSN